MTELERVELAKVAYRAYGGVTDWKNFRGDPMPEWDDLPPKIREAWSAAATAVRNRVLLPPPSSESITIPS